MLVNLACDWGRPSRNWPCAWTPSDYYRFLLSVSRSRFLSTDLQSAFWKRFGKSPSLGFPLDLTNLHALLNDQKGGLSQRIDFASTRIPATAYSSADLTDGLGTGHIASLHNSSCYSLEPRGATRMIIHHRTCFT